MSTPAGLIQGTDPSEHRKGIKEELRAEIDDDAGRLYDMYSESLRNLGTPVFSRRYLETLQDVFGSACDIVTILKGDRAVASVLNFYFRDEVLPYYGGGTQEARAVASAVVRSAVDCCAPSDR